MVLGERNYEFRRKLDAVHLHNRCEENIKVGKDEVIIENDWKIVIQKNACKLIYNVARDLEDYLFISMRTSIAVIQAEDVSFYAGKDKYVVFATKEQLPGYGAMLTTQRSYRLAAEKGYIVICGNDERGTAQGSYYLEDLMNLRSAPVLAKTDVIRKPLFQPRMVHSGWGIDEYPDAYLNAIAHAGMDSILLFVNGVDSIPGTYAQYTGESSNEVFREFFTGDPSSSVYKDFNDLVSRASQYGLDVYMYSYLVSKLHPDDPDAESYYESTYGEVIRNCPGFKGIVLCGESNEFPSKDPDTAMVIRKDSGRNETLPSKPFPGWWPCSDYPDFLNMIKKVVRKYNPDMEIILWSYNWGFAPREERLELIRKLPEDIVLLGTFEMYEEYTRNGVTCLCVDDTLAFEGPGKHFSSEAEAAHERGIKIYAHSNTGGQTWDVGVIPYEPAPYQWKRRTDALKKANADWGVAGLMESHHCGWWPSFISDIAKWAFWEPSPEPQEIFKDIARRDFSEEAVPMVLKAWEKWSEGIRCYVPTNEDQYGPFRIGPAYPLSLEKIEDMPALWYARFGAVICETVYNPPHEKHTDGGVQIGKEIASLEMMKEYFIDGNCYLEKALELTPEVKRQAGIDLLRLGRFIYHAVVTTINVKNWWLLKKELQTNRDITKINEIIDNMVQLAQYEIKNAEETIPLVKEDSRLGWEPSMEYMCDASRLEWKIRQVKNVMENELPNRYNKLG